MARSPRSLDRSSPLPLWAQLLEDLRARLGGGAFDGGFPGELALVDEYGVSRSTVREALRRLRTEGLVVAERGRRPRVQPNSSGPAPTMEIPQPIGVLSSLFATVESTGISQRSIVRALETRADGTVATRLGLEESTPLVYLERIRLAGGDPLAVDRVWLPADIAQPLLGADFTHTSLYEELSAHVGLRLSGGSEQIRAVIPTPAEMLLLGIGEGVACLLVDRLGETATRPVEWRTTLVRGDRFRLDATFSARGGYQLGSSGMTARKEQHA